MGSLEIALFILLAVLSVLAFGTLVMWLFATGDSRLRFSFGGNGG